MARKIARKWLKKGMVRNCRDTSSTEKKRDRPMSPKQIITAVQTLKGRGNSRGGKRSQSVMSAKVKRRTFASSAGAISIW